MFANLPAEEQERFRQMLQQAAQQALAPGSAAAPAAAPAAATAPTAETAPAAVAAAAPAAAASLAGRKRPRPPVINPVENAAVPLEERLSQLWTRGPSPRGFPKNRFADQLQEAAAACREGLSPREELAAGLERIAKQHTNLPDGRRFPIGKGYVSARDIRELEALLIAHQIQRPPPAAPQIAAEGLGGENQPYIHEIDDDDEEEDDGQISLTGDESATDEECQAAAEAVRAHLEQFSPTKPGSDDPLEVHKAYALISDAHSGFPRSIFFDLVPVLKRIYVNVRAG